MGTSVVVSAFYKFVAVDDSNALQTAVLAEAQRCGLLGSVIVADEGINGTVAGSREGIDSFFAQLRSDERFADLEVKESVTEAQPFRRMKVARKPEIVTFRQGVDPTKRVGTYVAPDDWNAVISDPDVLVIDTRNDEEIQIGTFVNAVNPVTETFTEFADYVEGLDPGEHPRVAMFCTGGIRCEKASSFLLERGFGEVMHLQGGILKYLEDVPKEESMWQGECFVFDDRVSVDHDLRPGSYTLCRGCRTALTVEDRSHPDYEEGVACRHCNATLPADRRISLRERHRQMMLAQRRERYQPNAAE